MSPRNSAAAVVGLLRKASCHRLVTTRVTLGALLTGIKEELNNVDPDFALTIEEVPSLEQTYPNLGAETLDSPFEPYPTSPNLPSFDDLCLYLHSSGSTGLPKAIPQTHKAVMQWAYLGKCCVQLASFRLTSCLKILQFICVIPPRTHSRGWPSQVSISPGSTPNFCNQYTG